MASPASPAMEFLGRVAFEATKMRPLLQTYLHLLLSAIFPIYMAAHASLARPSSAAKPEKKKPKDGDSSEDDDDDDLQVVQKIENLTAWDALTFPLLAGTTLTSLYFLINWLEDPTMLNKILAVYFSQIGIFFGTKFLKDTFSTIHSVILPTQYSIGESVWQADPANSCFAAEGPLKTKNTHASPLPGALRNIPLPQTLSSAIWQSRKVIYTKAKLHLAIHKVIKLSCPIDILDIVSFVIVASIVAWQTFVSTPWYLTNFMGFSFCYGSLQIVTPTTGWVGTLVLSALFFYDVYFVFFTPMMVTVATKLEVPIKLLFPRPDGCVMPVSAPEGSEAMQEYLDCLSKKRAMAMLGLGDIFIPGMMLAFALRFDLYLFYLRQQCKDTRSSGVDDVKKPKYIPATGSWGERLWTSTKLQSPELQAKSFPKPYFHASVFGYLAGMIVTILVMQVAQHAQPALLYLVPGVLISLWCTALFKADLKLFWAYTEDEYAGEMDKKAKDRSSDDKGKQESKDVEGEDEKDAKGNPAIKGKGNETEDVTTDHKSDDKAQKTSKLVASDLPTRIISFSITLPRTSKYSTTPTQSSKDTNTSPFLKSHPKDVTTSKPSSSVDMEESYDILPDVKADREVIDMLSREITRSKEEALKTTGRDGEPAGKR